MPSILTSPQGESSLFTKGAWTVSFSLFGYGLFLAWYWILFSTSIVTPLANESIDWMRAGALGLQTVILAGLTIYLRHSKGRGLPGKVAIYIAAPAGIITTAVMVGADFTSGTAAFALDLVGWIAYGICGAMLNYVWVKLYSVASPPNLCLYISGSGILAVAVVYILCYLPRPLTLILTALLPLMSTWLSSYARLSIHYEERDAVQQSAFDSKSLMPSSIIRLLIAILVFTFVYSALIAPLATRRGQGFEEGSAFMLAAPLIGALFILLMTWFSTKPSTLSNIYRLVLPIMVISLCIFPFMRNASISVAGFVGAFGFELFNIIFWVLIVDSAEYHGAPPLRGLAWGRVIHSLGLTLGMLAGNYLAANELFKDKNLFMQLCLIGVVVLVIVTMIVLRENDLFSKSGVSEEAILRDPEPEIILPAPEEIFEYKASAIADRYGLTRREVEVFLLLAKGRSNKLIEERLFISEHTVDSHVSHIYRKCGVHSRQEIMDLIEQEHVDVKALTAELALKRRAEEEPESE